MKKLLVTLFLCVFFFPGVVSAAEKTLVVGLASDALFLDPHQQDETITNAMTRHIYESLLFVEADGSLSPALAESWSVGADQLTWTFKLRKGVTFSDGTPLTAEDVLFSLERIKGALIKDKIASIKETRIVDDHTIEIVTVAPDAVLLDNLARSAIISKAYATRVGDAELNLKPMGTGPYVCTEWVKEDHISMERNDRYWGKAPAIAKVRYRPITNAATRTAALLSGEVDMIEDVPVRDVERVKKGKDIEVVAHPGMRLIYLHVDANREKTPAIDLPKNPLTDHRVRQALSMAINREAIVKVALNGSGYPTGQMVLEGLRGYIPGLPLPEYNPEKARALLKEAGYEKGFKVTLDAPNGRYVNDAQVAQAIASQLSKVGIEVNLNLMPKTVFFDYVRPGDKSSLVMTGWSEPIDAGAMANILFYTRGKNPNKGSSNRCHYANPAFDKLIDEADSTADPAVRGSLLKEASQVILSDVGLVPLYFDKDLYGKKKNVRFTPRSDKYILAAGMDIE